MSSDKIPLHEGGGPGASPSLGGGGQSKYGTVDEMEMEVEEEVPFNEPSKRKLAMGVGFSLLSAVTLALTVMALIHIGRSTVPALQVIVFAYSVQAAMLIPVAVIFFGAFLAETKEHFTELLFTGLLLSLGVLCGYQAAVILPGKVVVTLFPAVLMVITLAYSWCIEIEPDWIFGGICATSLTGLILMAAHGIHASFTHGWVPVISARDVDLTLRDGIESDSGAVVDTKTVTVAPWDAPEGTDDYAPGTGGVPDTNLGPTEHLMYAYCSLLLGVIVTTVGASMVHSRLHHIHMAPFLFWTALVGVLMSSLEFVLFGEPSWPARGDIITFIGAVIFLDVCILAVNIAWRHIHPGLLILVASSSVALFFLLEYTVPSFAILAPIDHPAVIEIIGVVLVLNSKLFQSCENNKTAVGMTCFC
ncbi:hypothetical protein CAPTEDRAFT_216831 [Capitella teleta]|uniref:EamA domain-containing protein n=1 Tax=Capitella teleta TaxID=283909 RepID=R7USH0_CAPTE|nr:hypothetical protein CAPTEDRAFT_216831 [Capitella teleta]|eukprot:ELU09145.1 hypothetical protein CAPTEDRAFT_216831 [Capitella teleta]